MIDPQDLEETNQTTDRVIMAVFVGLVLALLSPLLLLAAYIALFRAPGP